MSDGMVELSGDDYENILEEDTNRTRRLLQRTKPWREDLIPRNSNISTIPIDESYEAKADVNMHIEEAMEMLIRGELHASIVDWASNGIDHATIDDRNDSINQNIENFLNPDSDAFGPDRLPYQQNELKRICKENDIVVLSGNRSYQQAVIVVSGFVKKIFFTVFNLYLGRSLCQIWSSSHF